MTDELDPILEIDVRHMGVPRAICAFVHPEEGWIVDPGPESAVDELLAGLPEGFAPRRVLLTHIHFDHAGATGRLLERFPDAEVWVHERGAGHLIDPTRLVASARRLYGDAFDELWGEVVPLPEERVRVIEGDGADLDGPPGFRVAYAPGHAKHHVLYLHEGTRTAFCGDVAGIRVLDGPILPPTPPPDIDLEAWYGTLDRLRDWVPQSLAVTHFGRWSDVNDHWEAFRHELERLGELAREGTEEEYVAEIRRTVAEGTGSEMARAAYDRANPPETLYSGLRRYWDKKAAG